MEGNSHRAYFTGCLRFAVGMTFYPKEYIFLPVSILFLKKKKGANNKRQWNRTFVVKFFNITGSYVVIYICEI